MKDNLFVGKEIDAILKTAARLQNQDEKSTGQGLTTAELEKIAEESGIDAEYVRQAILMGAETESEEDGFQWSGAPTYVTRRFVINRRLSKEEMEAMVPLIEASTGPLTIIESLETRLKLSFGGSSTAPAQKRLTLTATGDDTVCEYSHNVGASGVPTFLLSQLAGLMIFLGFLVFRFYPADPTPASFVVLPFIVLTMFILARFGMTRIHRKAERSADRVIEGLQAKLGGRMSEVSATSDGKVEIPDEDSFEGPDTTRATEKTRSR